MSGLLVIEFVGTAAVGAIGDVAAEVAGGTAAGAGAVVEGAVGAGVGATGVGTAAVGAAETGMGITGAAVGCAAVTGAGVCSGATWMTRCPQREQNFALSLSFVPHWLQNITSPSFVS